MPRPAEITAEFVAASDAEMERYLQEEGRDLAGLARVLGVRFQEIWLCGAWLKQKLHAAGCSGEDAEKACFANGQRMAMAADPWAPTVSTLDRYVASRSIDQPGPELAVRLMAEAE